jgi:2-amino-4-hydroxy-6-hydroxymethyldihydropteridine diphosphokinase
MAIVYAGLGSNLGNREEYIASARGLIVSQTGSIIIAESSISETEPVDFTDQPMFINQIIKIDVSLDPEELLDSFKNIEKMLGRHHRFRKGPREIDIDILLYNNHIYRSERLVIPHPEIINRKFILQHLVELDPELTDPVTHKKYREVLINGSF